MFEWIPDHVVTTTAPTERFWAIWAAADKWPERDKNIEWVKSDGPFAVDMTGKTKPVGGPAMRTRMMEATQDASFTGRSELFLCHIDAVHIYTPATVQGGRASIRHRLEMRGPLTLVLRLLLGAPPEGGSGAIHGKSGAPGRGQRLAKPG